LPILNDQTLKYLIIGMIDLELQVIE